VVFTAQPHAGADRARFLWFLSFLRFL